MLFAKPLLGALCCASILLPATSASANLRISFSEGAPKDRFRIENIGACAVPASTLRLDLSTSQGALIFDVTGAGQGVEVYQPFELIEGRAALADVPTVKDGQSALDLNIKSLAPGEAIAFTIDVDDTLGQREITVSGSEIAGATVSHIQDQTRTNASFSKMAKADLASGSC